MIEARKYIHNRTFAMYLTTNELLREAYQKAILGKPLTEEEAMEINEAWSAANEP